MRLKIESIADKGNYEKERLVLKVLAPTDIGDYLLLQAGHNDGNVTIDTYHSFWFPYKKVNTGDVVVIYSKVGKENKKQLKTTGKTAYFYYWGLKKTAWSSDIKAPVILHAAEWISADPKKL